MVDRTGVTSLQLALVSPVRSIRAPPASIRSLSLSLLAPCLAHHRCREILFYCGESADLSSRSFRSGGQLYPARQSSQPLIHHACVASK